MDAFWEWALTSDPTTVLTTIITAILGSGGAIAALIMLLSSWLRDRPPHEAQEKAVETVTAPAPDRDALHIARQALEASAADRETVSALRARLDEMAGKVDRVTAINDELVGWIRDVWGRWHIVRQSETPPTLPASISNVSKEVG